MVMNTNGKLATEINEVIFPYDVDKIQRDCKFFSKDTIIVALELFKKLGLVYVNENDVFQIANYEQLVGSETSKAEIMRRKRGSSGNNVTKMLPSPSNIVTEEIEYRDKSNRDRVLELKKECVYKHDAHRIDHTHTIYQDRKSQWFPASEWLGVDTEDILKAKKDLFDLSEFSDSMKTAWTDFFEMRKSIKKPLTARGFSLLKNELNRITTNENEQIRVINRSIMNNWAGLFEIKEQKTVGKGKRWDDGKVVYNELTTDELFGD